MTYRKGESGNPSGKRTKTLEQLRFEKKCRDFMDGKGFTKLEKFIESEDDKVAFMALREMADRGYGRAEQTNFTQLDVTTEPPKSPDEIASDLSKLIGKPAAGDGSVDQGHPVTQ